MTLGQPEDRTDPCNPGAFVSARRRRFVFRLGAFLSAALAVAAIAVPAVTLPTGAARAETGDWVQERSELGITVFTRAVEGSSIREFRGEGLVRVPVDEILALLRTPARFKDWFPDTSESKGLPAQGGDSYQYSVMDIPWPISDRDNVLRTRLQTDPDTGRVDIQIHAAPDAYPEQSGRLRVRKAHGSWLLDPRGPGETFVRFQMHLEPGGGLPDWMVNARTVGTPVRCARQFAQDPGRRGAVSRCALITRRQRPKSVKA